MAPQQRRGGARLTCGTLAALAAALGACNAAWAVKTNVATPVMVALGLDLGGVGYARLAGPLTGAFVQPLAGSLMDARPSRRRPLLLCGAAALAGGMVLLARSRTQGAAVAALWVLDAGMNVVMAGSRCIVAALGARAQARGNAALAASVGAGQLLGFGVAAVPIWLEWLTFGVAVAVIGGALVTAMAAAGLETQAEAATQPREEREPLPPAGAMRRSLEHFAVPPWMRALVAAIFLSWLGWYSHILFTTQWIAADVFGGDARAAGGTPEGDAYARGVRWASGALAVFAGAAASGAAAVPALARAVGEPRALTISYAVLATLLACTSAVPRGGRWAASAIVACMGLPWAITQSLPYAVVAAHAPVARRGALLGTLNVFITLPEVTVDLGVKPLLRAIQGDGAAAGSGAGTVLLLGALPAALASVAALFVPSVAAARLHTAGSDDGDDMEMAHNRDRADEPTEDALLLGRG